MAVKDSCWSVVRQDREQKFERFPILGVYEKIDERSAVESFKVGLVDTKWLDTNKPYEEEPMQIRSRVVAREFESGRRPDLHAGTPPMEARKAILSFAADHEEQLAIMRIDVSRAYFRARAQRSFLVMLPNEDKSKT